jgi:hypothetical protein
MENGEAVGVRLGLSGLHPAFGLASVPPPLLPALETHEEQRSTSCPLAGSSTCFEGTSEFLPLDRAWKS